MSGTNPNQSIVPPIGPQPPSHGDVPTEELDAIKESRDPDPVVPLPLRPGVVRRTFAECRADHLADRAAALTYYAVLSVFPVLLVVVSVFSLFAKNTTQALVNNLTTVSPGPIRVLLTESVQGLQASTGGAVVMAIVGVLAALWAASAYVASFMRASNVVYDVPEGRPIWKRLPIRLALAIVVGVLMLASAAIVVFTGRLGAAVGILMGLDVTAMAVWDIAKWPVLVLLVAAAITVLYWSSPNAKVGDWMSLLPGSLLAVGVWLIASIGFGIYAANFASYNKTYGTLGAVIGFLVWLWLTNLAILVGAEFNAERHRSRAVARGALATVEPFVPLRDWSKVASRPSWTTQDTKSGPDSVADLHNRGVHADVKTRQGRKPTDKE